MLEQHMLYGISDTSTQHNAEQGFLREVFEKAPCAPPGANNTNHVFVKNVCEAARCRTMVGKTPKHTNTIHKRTKQ